MCCQQGVSVFHKMRNRLLGLKQDNERWLEEGVQLLHGQETAVKHTRVLYKKEEDQIYIRGKRITEIDTLKWQADILLQEKKRHISELTSMKEQLSWAQASSEKKDETIVELTRELDTLKWQADILLQEKKRHKSELTSVKEQMSQVEASNAKKDQTVVELTRELEAKQVERSTQEAQTDWNDILYSEDAQRFYSSVSYSSSYTDYSHGETGRWFSVTIMRPEMAEPPGKATRATVSVYNVDRARTSLPDICLFTQCQYGQKMYYHGTNAVSAKSILEQGIHLSKSSRNVDFSSGVSGGGFYVTDSFEKAEEWSRRVLRWRRGVFRAVIGFRINSSLQNEEDHLSLTMSRSSDKKLWEIIVSHFRRGETSPDVATVLRRVKYIEGPVSANKYLNYQDIPSAYGFNQLCIRDSDYARRFGSLENIAFVVFYL